MSAQTFARIKIEDLPPLEQLTEEEAAAIFGAGRVRLGIEQLESRELMASNLSASLTAGVLRIEGTDKADKIRIIENLGQISVANADTGETVFIKRNNIDKPSSDGPLLDIENFIVGGADKTELSGEDAKEAAALSVAISQFTRLELNPLDGDDAIWIGDGSGSLSVPLQVISGQGLDFLHSRGSEFVAGLDQGVKQLHEFNGNTYTVTTDDKLYMNGKEMSFGGYQLDAASITISTAGMSVTGLANVPVFGMVQVTTLVGSDGEFALKTEVLEGRKDFLGGLVQLDAPVITLTAEGAKLNAHAKIAEIGWAKLEGILTFDGNYQLLGVGGVEIGPLKYESVRFTLGSENVEFKVPVESIGEVSFKASFANGEAFIQGTYPQPVVVGNFTLINITVGLGTDRFSIGADVVPVPGIEGFVGIRFDGEIYFDGRFRLSGNASIKVGPFNLGNAKVVISNNPDVTTLKDRTVQMTIDANVQIGSVIDVEVHGTVDANGNYELSGEDTFRIASLELQKTKFTLKKGEGFKFDGEWKNPLLEKASLHGDILPSGRVEFHGTVEAKKIGQLKLGSLRIDGWAENGLFELKATDETLSIGDFSLTKSTVIFSNIGKDGKRVDPYTSVTGTITLFGLAFEVSGRVEANGYYNLKTTNSITPIPGFALAKETVSLEKGKGLHYVKEWNLGVFKAHLEGEITSAGTMTFRATSTKVAGIDLGDMKIEGTGNIRTGKFSFSTVNNDAFALGGFDLSARVTITNIDTPKGVIQAKIDGKLDVLGVKKVHVQGEIQSDGHYHLKATDELKLTIAGVTLKIARQELELEKGKGLTYSADWDLGLFDGELSGRIYSYGKVTFAGKASANVALVKLGKVELAGEGDVDRGTFTISSKTDTFSIGGFDVDGKVTITNDNKHRNVKATIKGTLDIPRVGEISVTGEVGSDGYYKLTSTAETKLEFAGLNLTRFDVTLERYKGLDFTAKLDFFVFNASISGSISKTGRMTFEGTDESGRLGGFKLSKIKIDAVVDPANKEYRLTFTTRLELGIASVAFKAETTRRRGVWIDPTFEGRASVTGDLKKILSGTVNFTLSSEGVSFSGSVKLPLNLGSFEISGTVKTNGTFTIGNKKANASGFDINTAVGLLKEAGANAMQAMSTVMKAYSTNLVGGIKALINGKYLANSSFEVAKFLLNTANKNLGTTAQTISDWLGGNKIAAFNAIVWGAGKGLVAGVNGLIGAKMLANNSFEVAKFLVNESGRGLGEAARAVSDWLGGNVGAAFWAIANGVGRGYADAIRALNWGGMLNWNFDSIYNFLKGQVGLSKAAEVLKNLGFSIPNSVAVNIPGLKVNVGTSGGSVQVGGYKVSW